jgi:hypothetical protein
MPAPYLRRIWLDPSRLASLQMTSGDVIKAIQERSMQATKDPWDPQVRLQLAELCEKANRPQLAKMWRTAAEACLKK